MPSSVSGRAMRAFAVVVVFAAVPIPSRSATTEGVGDRMDRAIALHQVGDYDGAIAALREVLAVDPGHADARYELVYSTFLKGDYPATIALAEKALAAETPGRAGLYVFLGCSKGMLGDWPAGEAVLRKGLEAWPEDAALHFHLGVSLAGQGTFDAAASEFEEALKRSPYQASNWRALADSLERAGRKGRAFTAYARSLTLDKGSQGAERAARRLREMLFESARSKDGTLRIGVRLPEGAARNEGATESVGMGLVAALRYGDDWKHETDSRFFVFAVDRVLELLSAMHPENQERDADFWGPYAYTYFDQGRAAGHMEALAYDLLASSGDAEALHWRRDHSDANRKYRDWSERWAVDWSDAR